VRIQTFVLKATCVASLMLLALRPAVSAAEVAPLERSVVHRADGSPVSFLVEAGAGGTQDALIILQGTGCREVSDNPSAFRVAELLAPDRRLVLINQPGVIAGAEVDLVDGCPTDYWERSTLHQRTLDMLLVVAELRRRDWWSGQLVLFGGSEGGAVVALAAALLPETQAAIVFSSGAGMTVRELIGRALPPPVAAELDAQIAAARENPSGGTRWAGLSHKWWADAADVMPARALVLSSAPILLIHGAQDTSSPVEAARAGRDYLTTAGKDVTYFEYPALDHFMREAGGEDRLPEVMEDARRWLAGAVP